MAMSDYGVITMKNGRILDEVLESENKKLIVKNGEAGKFRHELSGVVFYRMSIKNDNDVDRATEIIGLGNKSEHKSSYEIGGLQLNIKEIYPQTFQTEFIDDNGDKYMVIHGYDVSTNMISYWSNIRRDTVQELIHDNSKIL